MCYCDRLHIITHFVQNDIKNISFGKKIMFFNEVFFQPIPHFLETLKSYSKKIIVFLQFFPRKLGIIPLYPVQIVPFCPKKKM